MKAGSSGARGTQGDMRRDARYWSPNKLKYIHSSSKNGDGLNAGRIILNWILKKNNFMIFTEVLNEGID